MNDHLQIKSEIRDGIPILELDYGPNTMFRAQVADLLAEKLVSEYRAGRPSHSVVCVLNIKANTAGSPLVRAIFELYNVVSADSGTLYCSGYPSNYMESLTSLGLPALPGFKLTKTLDEAVAVAQQAQATEDNSGKSQ